jgi:ATP-dependent RNA helicase HelY
VLEDTELTAGDFVRWVRQVIDFAGQIADAAGPGQLRDVARQLVRTMRRGVVSYAAETDADEGDDPFSSLAPGPNWPG